MTKSYIESNYKAKIEDSKDYYYAVHQSIDINTYSDYQSPSRMISTREMGIAIHMTRDNFFRLENDLAELQGVKYRQFDEGLQLSSLRKQAADEKKLREQHLAVQQAYEKYQNLLSLVK